MRAPAGSPPHAPVSASRPRVRVTTRRYKSRRSHEIRTTDSGEGCVLAGAWGDHEKGRDHGR
jgi:hypothetical protein